MDSLLDTINGLPVHPLIVHFAVVLLPLATLATLISIYIPRFRKSYGFASVFGVFFGTVASVAAKQSGEALAARIGNPQNHANYGNILPIFAAIFFLTCLLWYRSSRRSLAVKPKLLDHITAVLGVGVLILTYLTGHSGAEAVWKGKLPSSGSIQKQDSGSSEKIFKKSEVAKNSSPQKCWSIVNNEVYDLTDWIGKHPGGAALIQSICGKDGTAAFDSQHMGQKKAVNTLAGYKIGKLG